MRQRAFQGITQSNGSRLYVSGENLRTHLSRVGLDLLVKVELDRKKGDRYGGVCPQGAFWEGREASSLPFDSDKPLVRRSKSMFWTHTRTRFQLVRVWATNFLNTPFIDPIGTNFRVRVQLRLKS